jgi:hypothetical protein
MILDTDRLRSQFERQPECCPYGHSLASGMPQRISWMACFCEPALKAAGQGKAAGHLILRCGTCDATPYRYDIYYGSPHLIYYRGTVSGWQK